MVLIILLEGYCRFMVPRIQGLTSNTVTLCPLAGILRKDLRTLRINLSNKTRDERTISENDFHTWVHVYEDIRSAAQFVVHVYSS